MSSTPPSPYRAGNDCASFDLGSHLKRVFTSVGFEPSDSSEIGKPGSYHGSARSGGPTYQFAVDLFAGEVMTKFDDDDKSTNKAKTKAALSRFWEAEALCTETNARFNTYFMGHRPANEQVARVLILAREKIGRLLEGVDWDRVRTGTTFTKRGSVLLPRAKGSPIHKYSSTLETTVTTSSTLSRIFSDYPSFGGVDGQGPGQTIVPGNKLAFVNKNFKTHRVIAAEPSGNMYLQKGLHKEFKRLLRSVGVDLSSQIQNQDWAHFGSKTGLIATVDMSMASDTVAYVMVDWFLSLNPEVWAFLDGVRSTTGVVDNRTVTYAKFSSMGNATTFELETLIFWALATATCDISKADKRFVGVYGDDVIIPNRCTPLFFDVLKECGFVPNEKKTFYDVEPQPGVPRFRESCGKHYFGGEDVTPVYIRKQPSELMDHFKLVNNLSRWLSRMEALSDAPDLSQAWDYVAELRALAPSAWVKPRIPDGYGDGAFIGTFDQCTPSTYKTHKKRATWVEGFRIEVLSERFDRAIGISPYGKPLVRNSKGKIVPYAPNNRVCRRANKQVEGVTATGFLRASLKRLEQEGPSVAQYMQRLSGRALAIAYGLREPATEAMALEITTSRQVSPSHILVPLGWGSVYRAPKNCPV